MSNFVLNYSTSLDILAESFAKQVQNSSIFEKAFVVVQSFGVQRYLSVKLANINGISANMKFLFPDSAIKEIADKIGIELNLISTAKLSWKIYNYLQDQIDSAPFFDIKNYCYENQELNELKLFKLSEEIAKQFELYSLFRADILKKWRVKVDEKSWQELLWSKDRKSVV